MRPNFSFYFSLVTAALLFAPGAAAQSASLNGVVTSAETGAPVIAAVVQILSADGGRVGSTLTNQTGRFQASNVPSGTYIVSVSSTGYARARTEGVVLAPGQAITVNFSLIPSAVDLDPVVVSASRGEERALAAPARTEVVNEQEIEVRPAVTPADHLRGLPGVDIATSGVQSTNVVTRGFNNVFSGSLYMLSDHRIAGVPSLRVNLLHFIPTTNEDIERIEVVLGPGSALYGPGTANGVLHILTQSPLTSQGTSFSVAGGERSLLHGTARTSHLLGENFGIKVSGQYLQADEWRYVDPIEAAEQAKYASDLPFWRQDLMRAAGISQAEADLRINRIANRDYDVQRWSGEARADWRVTPELTTVLSVGTNTGSGIELTGLGAGQTEDWRTDYYQLRANWRRAFGQVYLNQSDAGDTYLLRNGAPITDKSKLFVAQLQNGADILGGRQDFVYGLDFIRTVPVTEGTINGIYEDEDETTEFGGYLQSTTSLTPKLDLVLAGRVDTHSALPEAIFSPRAALVFSPSQNQSFRATFNRAFSTPTSLTQFLDLGTASPNPLAGRLGYSVRVQGTGDRGFTFAQPDGSYQMRSPFAQLLGVEGVGASTLLPATQAGLFWPIAVQLVGQRAGLAAPTIQFLQGLPGSSLPLNFAPPAAGSTQTPLSQLNVAQLPAIREETSTTFEVGYKGILGQRVLLAADAWWSRRENLVTPLTAATPFIHFDAASTQALLTQALEAAGQPPAMAQEQAAALANGISSVPLGVISSADVNANSAQILVTYFNVDDELDLYGTDLSFTALLTDALSLEATASFVSDDVFQSSDGMRVTLNAPKRKGSVAAVYRNLASGLNGEARVRYNAAYPVDSGVYKATECLGDDGVEVEPCVGDFALFDVNVGHPLPGFSGATLQLSIQNLFDEDYRSFPGVPSIGRMAILRLRYELP